MSWQRERDNARIIQVQPCVVVEQRGRSPEQAPLAAPRVNPWELCQEAPGAPGVQVPCPCPGWRELLAVLLLQLQGLC